MAAATFKLVQQKNTEEEEDLALTKNKNPQDALVKDCYNRKNYASTSPALFLCLQIAMEGLMDL
jgi:hypothetical protein